MTVKHLRVVAPAEKSKHVKRKRTPTALPRESASDIAARIRKGRKPAKQRLFFETEKRPEDVVISSIGNRS